MPTPTRTGHVRDRDVEWLSMPEGTRRKVLVYEPQLLLMRNHFDAGVASALHSHPHVQASYILSGRFEITIGETTETLTAGDSFLIPADAPHSATCLEAGDIIETFTPIREDFF